MESEHPFLMYCAGVVASLELVYRSIKTAESLMMPPSLRHVIGNHDSKYHKGGEANHESCGYHGAAVPFVGASLPGHQL